MPPERSLPPRSVLVVDHDKDSAESLAAPLRQMGSDVEVAHDGPSALAVERTFRPDIVLIDLGLPGMDAYTVARFLRAQPQRNVSLVSVAELVKAKDRLRAKEAGFRYHLRKPADLAAIQAMFVALGVAEETAADAARKAVVVYQRGIITKHEFVLRVLESGARHDPAEMADLIPPELLDAVRQAADSPNTPYIPNDKPGALLTALRPHRILIVDDDRPRAEEVAIRIKQGGHTVEIAHDPQSTLELERTFVPELVIVELALSGMDAYAIARSLRAQTNRKLILASTGWEPRAPRALAEREDSFDDHMNEYKSGTLFLMRRRKGLTVHEPFEDHVAHLLRLVEHQTVSFADEQIVICMLAAAVCPSSPAELAALIPDEFLCRIRAFAEFPTDLANYLVGYKQKVFAEGEYWEDVLEGASLWSRFFNP